MLNIYNSKIKMSKYFLTTGLIIVCIFFEYSGFANNYEISSPDKKIKISVNIANGINWSASVEGESIFNKNKMSLIVDGEELGTEVTVLKAEESSFSGIEEVAVSVKSKTIENNYNQLHIEFKGDFAVSFRVFNNGIAYRFETTKKGKVIVDDEQVTLNFTNDFGILFPEESTLLSHYERLYKDEKLSSLENGSFCSLPTLVKAHKNIKIGITEADLYDYPGLFLEATGSPVLKSKFQKVILESKPKGDRDIEVINEAKFIANTDGTRTFPWRVFMISREDKNLVENQMVYLLSRECQLDDISWIKPGLVVWDWWNDNNLYGVDFNSTFQTF